MKKLIKLFFMIIILSNYSCNKNIKTQFNTDKTDSIKSAELISHILSRPNNIKCISEKGINNYDLKQMSYDMYKYLKITDTTHFNSQIRLFEKFKINKNMVPGMNIVSVELIDKLINDENNRKSTWKEIFKDCKMGFNTLSKPLFNENYDIAIVQSGLICGSLCGGSETSIYRFEHNKWNLVEIISEEVI